MDTALGRLPPPIHSHLHPADGHARQIGSYCADKVADEFFSAEIDLKDANEWNEFAKDVFVEIDQELQDVTSGYFLPIPSFSTISALQLQCCAFWHNPHVRCR